RLHDEEVTLAAPAGTGPRALSSTPHFFLPRTASATVLAAETTASFTLVSVPLLASALRWRRSLCRLALFSRKRRLAPGRLYPISMLSYLGFAMARRFYSMNTTSFRHMTAWAKSTSASARASDLPA